MPCIFGIIDPSEDCRGTECQTCTAWDDLCAGCGEGCAKGAGLCEACEAQLLAQPTGWEENHVGCGDDRNRIVRD